MWFTHLHGKFWDPKGPPRTFNVDAGPRTNVLYHDLPREHVPNVVHDVYQGWIEGVCASPNFIRGATGGALMVPGELPSRRYHRSKLGFQSHVFNAAASFQCLLENAKNVLFGLSSLFHSVFLMIRRGGVAWPVAELGWTDAINSRWPWRRVCKIVGKWFGHTSVLSNVVQRRWSLSHVLLSLP